MRTKAHTTIPAQSKPKSISELTPFELSEINDYQTANRGFNDDGDDEDDNRFFDFDLED